MRQSKQDLERQVTALQQRVDNLTRMNGILRKLVLSISKSNGSTTQPLPKEPDKRVLH